MVKGENLTPSRPLGYPISLFRCACDRGYTLDKTTGGNCTDVNECEDPQSCKYGICINSEGSYTCQCPSQFELLPSGNYIERVDIVGI